MAGKKTGKRLLTWVLVLVMALSLLPLNALAVSNSTVKLHPSDGSTVTGVKVKVGDIISGHRVSSISGYDITVDLGKYNVNNDTFRLPYAKDIWKGVDNNKVDYISWAGSGSNRRSEGASALLANGKNTAYYYFKGAPVLPTFTLNYNANGGTDAPASQTHKATSEYEKSHTFTISSQAPTRDGYTFLGWNTNRSATTANYQPGGSIVVTGTTTLYAVWQPKTPSIDEPAKPTENDVTGVVVDIVCVTTTGTLVMVQYPLGYPTDAQHTIGEVISDGAGGYICPVTVRTAWFVQQASDLVWKVQHTRTASTITFNLTYDKNSETWVKPAANPRIEATHEVTPDEPGDTKPDFEKEKAKIRVQCVEWPSQHNPYTKNYGILPGAYTDRGMDNVDGTYVYTIELDKAQYIARFNQDINKSHTDTEPNEKTYIEWRWENGAWHLIGGPDGVDADIKVKCGQTETPPEAPTADVLKKLEMAVLVKCDVDDTQQHTEAYGLLGEYNEDYFVGAPKKDGDDWLCDINYYPERYVAEFNTTFQNLKHVQNDEKIVPVTLIWADGSWQLKTQGRVHVTEVYTVTYTDGVENEEVFADQVYSDLRKDSATPAFNGTPTRTGYTFAGWEPEVAETVTETVTYAAKWTPVEPTHDDIFKALNGLVTVTCINRFWKDGNKNMDCGQGQYAAKAGIAGQEYTLEKGENAGTWVVTFPVTNFVKSFKQDPAHNLYTKDTLRWYIRWENNAWTSAPVEPGVDDLVKLTHAPTDWREVAKIATGGKSDCIHVSCVNGETGVCDYGITVPFVYSATDVVSVEPEDGVPGSYIATFKVDRYIDTCAKACNDKNFKDAPRTHKLMTQETVQWRLYATSEADEKIGNNVLNHVWEAEPVKAGKDDVCTIAHNWVVTFNPDNGGDTFKQNVEYEGKAIKPTPDPEKTGYTFDGWYLDEAEAPFSFDTTITSDITLTAKWHVTLHNIYAYARLNSYFAPLTTSEFDTPVTLNEATLSRLGLGSYNSLGYISIGSFTFDAMPLTSDLYFGDDAELSAVAEKLATDIALETGVSDKIVEKIAWTALYKTVNEEDMEPGYPAEAGYQLSGNLNLASVTFRAGAENVENMPAVNYTYDDGAIDFYDFYFAGDTITLPTTEPTREGYSFKGWSVEVIPAENDADCYDADGADDAADETLLKAGDTYTITAGGVIFTAQWEKKTFTVKYYLPDETGAWVEKKMDTVDSVDYATYSLWTPNAEDGYEFSGWYQKPADIGVKAKVEKLYMAKEWKLYGKFTPIEYTIQYVYNDGKATSTNPTTYTVESDTITLADATGADWGKTFLEFFFFNVK